VYYFVPKESYRSKLNIVSMLKTCHCVSFQEKLSPDQAETALVKMPSLLEIAGHTYFFGGFLVGPQVSKRGTHSCMAINSQVLTWGWARQ
jgi:hypothetical protein